MRDKAIEHIQYPVLKIERLQKGIAKVFLASFKNRLLEIARLCYQAETQACHHFQYQ